MNVSDQKHLKIVKTISIKQGGVDQNHLNNFQMVLVCLTAVLGIRITKHSFGTTSFLKLRYSFRMNLFIILSWSMKYVNNCRKIIIKNWLEPIIRIIKNGKIKLRLLIESLNLEFFGTKKFCHEILFFISVFVALDEKNHF